MLRRGELLGPWDRCRTHPRASPDTFARRPTWRPMFDDQSSGRRGQRSAHGPRARGGCGVCLARRRGRVNSRRSSRSADLERRAGPPPGPAGARRGHGRGQKSFEGLDYYKSVTVPSSLVPWPALGRSAPRGGAVKRDPTDFHWSILAKKPNVGERHGPRAHGPTRGSSAADADGAGDS